MSDGRLKMNFVYDESNRIVLEFVLIASVRCIAIGALIEYVHIVEYISPAELAASAMSFSVSGEIFCRSKSPSESPLRLDSRLKELDEFLGADSNSKLQRSLRRQTLEKLRNIRMINATVHQLSHKHDSSVMHQLLDSSCNRVLKEVNLTCSKQAEEIRNLVGAVDAKLMGMALEYFSILREETDSTREKLNENSIECNRRKHEAKRLRDLQIFSKHLESETQGCISFNAVACESSHWKRCGKAVQENVSSSGMLRYIKPY